MSSSSQRERSPNMARVRPKRRAASSHLFKYQLACDPSRAEDSALKKALQESLEDQKDLSDFVPTAPGRAEQHNQNNRARIINSSTNSSDVSRNSNNSSSTSNESRVSMVGDATKRTRSSLTSSILSLPTSKRAKLIVNGHGKSNSIVINKEKCDNSQHVSSGSSSKLNTAIRTYSRNHRVHDQESCKQVNNKNMAPRSSTPINKKNLIANGRPTDEIDMSQQGQAVSRSTQTSAPKVGLGNTQVIEYNHTTKDTKSKQEAANDKNASKGSDTQQQGPVVQYLKFKRESKNYAYAKMTALYVNTSRSPSGSYTKSSVKKVSPTGVLNNSSVNKTPGKSSPKDSTNVKLDRRSTAGRKSPSANLNSSNSLPKSSPETSKTTSKHVPKNVTPNGIFTEHTLDLSEIQSQTNINKKQTIQGSWSLLGVPEEKVIYLRDDEPPKRMICYPAIKHIEGDVIQVRDSVLLRSGPKQTDLPYIAKVVAFWEDAETGNVMMSLFWYYRPEHIEEGRKPHHLADEIFASRHRDIDSVECIEDKCYVLTFNEYCRWRKRLKMEQVNTTWSLADVTIPVSNEAYPRRNRIPDTNVNPELVFCCRQIYDSRMKRLIKNPLINPKYGHI